jgi:hypothetical protein
VPAVSSMAQGKAPASRMAAIRSQRASEVIPNRAWATASVMSSAPDSRGGRPSLRRRGRLSWIFTYSAVMRGVQIDQHNRMLDTLTVFPQPDFDISRLGGGVVMFSHVAGRL